MDCQQIRIQADPNSCNTITVTNKGTLNIKKVLIRSPDGTIDEAIEDINVGESKGKVIANFEKVSLLPVIEVGGELFGCKDKTLTVQCP